MRAQLNAAENRVQEAEEKRKRGISEAEARAAELEQEIARLHTQVRAATLSVSEGAAGNTATDEGHNWQVDATQPTIGHHQEMHADHDRDHDHDRDRMTPSDAALLEKRVDEAERRALTAG